jgi:uncharacterized membrane protein YhaH (DUF805 family)
MPFCEQCGAGMNNEARICAKCGAETAVKVEEQNPYAPPQYSAIGRTEKRRDSLWSYFTGAFKKYAVFKGRARRAEYWGFTLFWSIIYIVLSVFDVVFDLYLPGETGILSTLWTLVTLLPDLSLTARRMHDNDKSGWFMLIPIYGFILCFTRGTIGPNRFGPDPRDPDENTE